MTKGQFWAPTELNLTLDKVGVNVKQSLLRTGDWKQKLYDIETPRVESKMMAEKLTI
jgi:hypothetical protein